MNVKYQIFVSSTYEDLKKEREQVVKAILEMSHIPVGMEMFSAADEEQWKLIARQIDDSDYYVVIIAHRYGSLDGAISYTEKEYDYATKRGVPVLGFILDSTAHWAADRIDKETTKLTALTSFKEKVKQKLVSFWSSADDLHGKVSIALMKQMSANPRTGWVPASQTIAPEMTAELTRLSKENADLRVELRGLSDQLTSDAAIERERTLRLLRENKVTITFWYRDSSDWEDPTKITLNRIFFLLAPELMIDKSTEAASNYLGLHELRRPGWGMEFGNDTDPFYHHMSTVGDSTNAIESTVELVYPRRFLRRLCDTALDQLKQYFLANELDPYDSFVFGTYWIRELNR